MRSFFQALFRRRPYRYHPSIPKHRTIMDSATSTSGLLYAATISLPSISASRPDDELTTDKAHHVKGGGFGNPWPSWYTHSVWGLLSGLLKRRFNGTANRPDTTPPTVPVRSPTFLPDRSSAPEGKLRATWLGHACFYVEYPSGLRVLFDPVFTDRCSPFSFLGPKRYTPAPCHISDIPTIDLVVISHNHYDHLSHPTVTDIAQRHPNVHFFVPLGNKAWFTQKCGIHNCTELDWWDEVDVTLEPSKAADGIASQRTSITSTEAETTKPPSNAITARISCLPCQHIGARGPFDRGKTLWSSWAVTSGARNSQSTSVYFAGDTGYRSVPEESEGKDDWSEEYASLPHCPAFADIGRLRGPFDLGLIPIGAYMPRWIMSPMHANPRDSVEIFRDTRCQRALGMHWGTWILTEEDVLEPPRKLKEALSFQHIPETGVFDVCDLGESREF